MVSRKLTAAVHPTLAALVLLFVFSTVSTPPSAFASSSIGSTRVASAKLEEREATAQDRVGNALRVWQERLNLKNWDIRVQLVHPNMLAPKTLGNIHWDLRSRQATIDVLSAYDYTLPEREMLDDMEFTVVHELVHLQLASLPRSQASRGEEEYAVNQLSHALLNLAKR
jgi:hypothetical protein